MGEEAFARARREGRPIFHGVATAFVCERRVCQQPTADPAELAAQLARVKPLLPDRSPAPI